MYTLSPPQAARHSLQSLPQPQRHIGIDEAGRGCLAGPVVAAAVILPEPGTHLPFLHDLDDSKKLTARKRDTLAKDIRTHALAFGIGFAWQREIDCHNILCSTFFAMARAVAALHHHAKKHASLIPVATPLFVDGNHALPAKAMAPYLSLFPQQYPVVDGDARVPSIAAASILAKTVRDALLIRLDQRYPGYGFAQHKGYGTRAHLAHIRDLGPCSLHRMTFKGVLPEQPAQTQYSLL